jgi:hypothetical protein
MTTVGLKPTVRRGRLNDVTVELGHGIEIALFIADAELLHEQLGATLAEVKAAAAELDRCLVCFGTNGNHGLIHTRNEAGGGGSNTPCPNAETAVPA